MKLVLLALVVAVALFLMLGRRKPRPPAQRPDAAPPSATPAGTVPMIACARCGVHLPRDEAVTDATGTPYCGEAHRAAGPR